MRILSIHVDESGDFGSYNPKYAPNYIFTLVFHDQENDILEEIKNLDKEMANLGFFNHVVHTGPLIRKEEVYCNLSANERRAIFTKLFYFTKRIPITYKIFTIERKDYPDEEKLQKKINKVLLQFIDENLSYFTSFDCVIIYYDNGQAQLAHELIDVFENKLSNVYRKSDVHSYKYKLLQVADMLCTLKLLEIKANRNELSKSEIYIFHSAKELRKDFVKKLKDKEFRRS